MQTGVEEFNDHEKKLVEEPKLFFFTCQLLYCCAYFGSIELDLGTNEKRKQ